LFKNVIIHLMSTKIFVWIVGLIFIALVYGIVNFVFVGAQSLYHSKDNAKLEFIKSDLDEKLKIIKQQEDNLRTQESFLDKTKKTINITTDTDDHNNLVDKYNVELALYKANYSRYSQDLESYNLKVNEANKLAEKVGTTWYVVPIPRGK
jgi:hypothetical protein